LLGSWYYAGSCDNAGADSGARPGGNGCGLRADPMENNPNTASWASTFIVPIVVVAPYIVGTVQRLERLLPSLEMVGETETESE